MEIMSNLNIEQESPLSLKLVLMVLKNFFKNLTMLCFFLSVHLASDPLSPPFPFSDDNTNLA